MRHVPSDASGESAAALPAGPGVRNAQSSGQARRLPLPTQRGSHTARKPTAMHHTLQLPRAATVQHGARSARAKRQLVPLGGDTNRVCPLVRLARQQIDREPDRTKVRTAHVCAISTAAHRDCLREAPLSCHRDAACVVARSGTDVRRRVLSQVGSAPVPARACDVHTPSRRKEQAILC